MTLTHDPGTTHREAEAGRPTDRDATLRAADARARAVVQNRFGVPIVLEAGAGTGKTTILVARVLAWCLGPGWTRAADALVATDAPSADAIATAVLRRVVAITFTEKAAAEMGERIASALVTVEAGDLPGWLLATGLPPTAERCRRARALRGALDHLVVQTIHAYCRRILVEQALDAGLHPNLEIDADGRLRADVVRSVVVDRLSTAYAEPGDSDWLALSERGVGPREIEAEVLALLDAGLPAEALDADPAAPARISDWSGRLRAALEAWLEAEGGVLRKHSNRAGDTAACMARILARLRDDPPRDRLELEACLAWLRDEWTELRRSRMGSWRRGKFQKGETETLGDRCAGVSAAAASLSLRLDHAVAIDLPALDLARRALRPVLADTYAGLRSRGIATFSALLSETRDLLVQRSDVARRVRSGIDQLLVDEFQDTDSRQCEIVRALALEGPAESRPVLFLVGDPKQSIYGWRNADLAAYDAFLWDVLAAGGLRERLSVNYRSAPEILAEVERTIAPVMHEQVGVQPAFQPLVAHVEPDGPAGFSKGGRAAVEHWVAAEWDGEANVSVKTRSGDATALEASALARDLRALHDDHDVEWGSVGILCRSRGDWDVILGALREAGVPYAVEGDRSYFRRREIIEASSLLRCVVDPNDHVALLSFLRSPAVGVPDAAWIPLWSRRFPERLAEATRGSEERQRAATAIREAAASLPAEVTGIDRIRGWEVSLLAAMAAIVALRESFARDPRDEFVEKLRTHSLIEATESARRLGAWRCANLERFFSELRDSLADGEDPHVLVRRLRIAIASEEEGEEARPQEILAEAVSVMTIHGAKGLDFEHVYVMQLHKGSAGSDDTGVAAESAGGFEFRLFGSPSLAWDAVADRRAAITEAERVRLLYVAMTRAKRRLVLAGVRKEHQKRTSRGQTVDLLRHRDGGEDALSARMREAAGAATGTGAVADAFGARWYFPAQASPAPDKVPGKPTVEAPAATEAEAEAEWRASDVELAGHCERARARMERPVSAAASSVAHASESRPRGGGSRAHADAARRIGTAIHAVLEEFDFEADRKQEIDSQRQRFAEAVSRWDDGASIETALALFDRVVQGACFARLCALSSHIIARELSVLLPPAVPLPSDGEAGPVGYFSGTIDLLYADPDTGRWVVADYKTDGIETDDDRAQRTEIYTKQGAVYCRAVRDALGLEALPRFELWFLSPDEIVDASLPDDSQADPRIGSTDAVEALVAKRRTGNES